MHSAISHASKCPPDVILHTCRSFTYTTLAVIEGLGVSLRGAPAKFKILPNIFFTLGLGSSYIHVNDCQYFWLYSMLIMTHQSHYPSCHRTCWRSMLRSWNSGRTVWQSLTPPSFTGNPPHTLFIHSNLFTHFCTLLCCLFTCCLMFCVLSTRDSVSIEQGSC